jgi:copper chaperone
MSTQPTVEANPGPRLQAARRAVTELRVQGMTCGHCAQHVTEAIQSVAGVHSANVSLEGGAARVRWQPQANPDAPAVIKAIQAAGYRAGVVEETPPDAGERKLADWQLNLWIGVLGTLPLMIGEWALGLGAKPWFGGSHRSGS